MKKVLFVLCLSLLCLNYCFSQLSFSSSNTKVNKVGDQLNISLTDGKINSDDLEITAKSMNLYGQDYSFINASGTVKLLKKQEGLTLLCPQLSFDRVNELLLIDSWVEILDPSNELSLSAARLSYDLKSSIMTLQMMVRIQKNTEDGMLECIADSVTYDEKNQTLILQGSAHVIWADNVYDAQFISIDLKTNALSMQGSIQGTVNGR